MDNDKTINNTRGRSKHVINATLLPKGFIHIRSYFLFRKNIITTGKRAVMYKILNH